jgi:AcrR family transcriptional regulator
MGPKTKFSKEQIIDAAFGLARECGIENVTLRKVAEELGSSVAPIYVNFNDAQELMAEVAMKAQAIAIEMSSAEYTNKPFLNIGIGTLKFAREYSKFYNSQLLFTAELMRKDIDTEEVLLEQMKKDQMLQVFTDQELKDMLLKMGIFTHGLASMASKQLLPPEYDEAMLIDLMTSTGEDIVMAARIKREGNNHEIDNH